MWTIFQERHQYSIVFECYHSLNNYEKVIKMLEKVWRLEKKV